MRITNNGDYGYCRWAMLDNSTAQNISQVHPLTWFRKGMAPVREALLKGDPLESCRACHVMEQHGKVSGRQKQLLKAGVQIDQFEKTMLSSPWLSEWQASMDNAGEIALSVQDWQIDLGNFCNSACLFCLPGSSSRLAAEQLRLGLIAEMPGRAWCDDQRQLNDFVDTLQQSPNTKYLHFIGGETIITPAFRTILRALIKANLNRTITLGFTTNLTVIDQEIVDLLGEFAQINLGLSIECLDPVNDYVRYGGTIDRTRELLDRWVAISRQRQWLTQIRTTPTILTISKLNTLYDYAWHNKIVMESCNFIERPMFMRPSVLPQRYRSQARDILQDWIDSRRVDIDERPVVNIRHPDFVQQQILQDAHSYVRYLDAAPDQSHLLPDLIDYLKLMESSRGNRVLDYLPEYEELFRSAGY